MSRQFNWIKTKDQLPTADPDEYVIIAIPREKSYEYVTAELVVDDFGDLWFMTDFGEDWSVHDVEAWSYIQPPNFS